jgi:putative membrane protein
LAQGQGAIANPTSAAISDLAERNLAQVALGRLALQKSADPQIRTLASRMVKDGTSDYEQLSQIALHKGLPFPSQQAGNQKLLYDKLSQMSGPDFDRAYRDVTRMALDDKNARLTSLRGTTGDPTLEMYIDRNLPKVRIDLHAVRAMQRG